MPALTRTGFAIQTEKAKRKGKLPQNFEVSEVEKEWVSNYTSLSRAYFQFSHIFSISQQMPGSELLAKGNGEWRSSENNSDGTKDLRFFFLSSTYVNLEEGYECFKPPQ